jgi:hypothetical protein
MSSRATDLAYQFFVLPAIITRETRHRREETVAERDYDTPRHRGTEKFCGLRTSVFSVAPCVVIRQFEYAWLI